MLKLEKRKIFEELERHWFFVKFFLPFIVSILLFLLAIYFDSSIFIALPFFLISAFLPDILFIFLSIFSNKHKIIRRKTHSISFMLFYSLFLFFLLPFLLKVKLRVSLIIALFSFFGFSLHLLVDTFEDFLILVLHLSSLFKKLTKRKRC